MPRFTRLPVPTEAENVALARAGDRRTLAARNLPLAWWTANRHRWGLTVSDAFAAASLGLVDAANGFDPSRQRRFSTYAVTIMLRRIRDEARILLLPLVVPNNAVYWMIRLKKGGRGTACQHARAALAERAYGMHRVEPLSDPADPHTDPRDDVGPDLEKIPAMLGALGLLGTREARVIRARFGIGCDQLSLRALGRELGITWERVRQIEVLALDRLRQRMEVHS